METFVAVVQEMLTAIAVKYNLKDKGLDPAAVPEIVRQAFAEVMSGASRVRPEDLPPPAADGFIVDPGELIEEPPAARIVLSQFTDSLHAAPPLAADSGLVSEELLHRSIRSSVELAEALAGLATWRARRRPAAA